jgi:hypothetical protein
VLLYSAVLLSELSNGDHFQIIQQVTLLGWSLLYRRTDCGISVAFLGHSVGVAVLRTAITDTRYSFGFEDGEKL